MIQPFAGKFVVMIEDDRLVLDSMDGCSAAGGRVSASTSSGAALADLSELDQKPDSSSPITTLPTVKPAWR